MSWWAEGLLFENCNCTAVCPGHVHFSQPCTWDICHGFWAIRFTGGEVDGESLEGLDAVVVYESPQVMIDGGWTEVIIVTDRATAGQARVVEELLTGKLDGPWAVLARFVSERLPTRTAAIEIEDTPTRKAVTIAGLLKGAVETIRGRDKSAPVLFQNIYNQIHDATQVIARGSTEYDDGRIRIATDGTHGLWSDFRWEGPSNPPAESGP